MYAQTNRIKHINTNLAHGPGIKYMYIVFFCLFCISMKKLNINQLDI